MKRINLDAVRQILIERALDCQEKFAMMENHSGCAAGQVLGEAVGLRFAIGLLLGEDENPEGTISRDE